MIRNEDIEPRSGLHNNFFLCAPVHEPAWFYTTAGLANGLASLPAGTEAIPGGTGAAMLVTQEVCSYSSICVRLIRGATVGASPVVTGRIVGQSPWGGKVVSEFRIKSARKVESITGAGGTENFAGGSIIAVPEAFARVDRIIFDTVSANNADQLEIGYCMKYLAPFVANPAFSGRGNATGTDYGTKNFLAAVPHRPVTVERTGRPGATLFCDEAAGGAQRFNDTDIVLVADENVTLRLEIDTNSTITPGNILVARGATAQENRDNLIAAINAQGTRFEASIDYSQADGAGALRVTGGGVDFLVETFRAATGEVPSTKVIDSTTGVELDRRIFVMISGVAIPAQLPYAAKDGDLIEIDDGVGNVVTFELDSTAAVDAGNTSVTIGGVPPTTTATNLATAINASALVCFAQDVGTSQGVVRIRDASPLFRVRVFSANNHIQYWAQKCGQPRTLGGLLEGQLFTFEMFRIGSTAAGTGVKNANLQPVQATQWENGRISDAPFGLLAETAEEVQAIGAFQNHIADNSAAGEVSQVYQQGQTLALFGLCRPRRLVEAQYHPVGRYAFPGQRNLLTYGQWGQGGSQGQREGGSGILSQHKWDAADQD